MHCLIGADERLLGDKECFLETRLSGQLSHLCHGSIGDSLGDKVCILPSELSGSSSGLDTGFCITCLTKSSMDEYWH